ncbi:hypothetical protein C8R47DRAFT_220709 [Mycena vitilis]|nr:hypothetical protein C8R47DRAFT_220709 [Mycena vitilis]
MDAGRAEHIPTNAIRLARRYHVSCPAMQSLSSNRHRPAHNGSSSYRASAQLLAPAHPCIWRRLPWKETRASTACLDSVRILYEYLVPGKRLAEALKILVEEVGGTIEWAKDKLDSFPKAKRPLLDAMGRAPFPLTPIRIAHLPFNRTPLASVLNLVGNLLSGLGLDGFLKAFVGATGLDKMYIWTN